MNQTGMFAIVFAATPKTITLLLDGLYSCSVYKHPVIKVLIHHTDANNFKPYIHILHRSQPGHPSVVQWVVAYRVKASCGWLGVFGWLDGCTAVSLAPANQLPLTTLWRAARLHVSTIPSTQPGIWPFSFVSQGNLVSRIFRRTDVCLSTKKCESTECSCSKSCLCVSSV